MSLPYTDLDLLFPDVTQVDVSIAQKGQVEYLILQQFGFAFEVNSLLDKNFYTIDMDCNQASGAIYKSGTAQSNASHLFEAMKDSTAKYLNDVSGDEVITVDPWSTTTLVGTADASGNIGDQILKAVLNPILTDKWGTEAIANVSEIYSSGNMSAYDSDVATLDHRLAKGLALTISSASDAAHDEVIGHLLDQVKDASGSIATDLEAARAMSLITAPALDANGVAPYAQQDFWMKVYLDVDFNGAAESVTDYEQDVSGFDPNNALADDDNEGAGGAADSDSQANLVKKTASTGDAVTMNAIQPTFLDKFKGSIKHSGTTTVDFGAAGGLNSTNHGIADDAEVNVIRVPVLLKFHVDE